MNHEAIRAGRECDGSSGVEDTEGVRGHPGWSDPHRRGRSTEKVRPRGCLAADRWRQDDQQSGSDRLHPIRREESHLQNVRTLTAARQRSLVLLSRLLNPGDPHTRTRRTRRDAKRAGRIRIQFKPLVVVGHPMLGTSTLIQ